jgi:hypothetical protein
MKWMSDCLVGINKASSDTVKRNVVASGSKRTRLNNMLDAIVTLRKAVGDLSGHGDGIVCGRVEALDMPHDVRESFPFLPHCKWLAM